MHNQGIQMLGQIKHGFSHPRAILFKVPADTIGIDCRVIVGLPKEGELERTDSHRHVIVSRIRNICLLYSLLPGEPNVANVAWGRNKNAPTEQSTPPLQAPTADGSGQTSFWVQSTAVNSVNGSQPVNAGQSSNQDLIG
ncbi:hypothetical protein Hdeb2414_s0001g00025411 [Helianthus debilis subsp. tardiflorus]